MSESVKVGNMGELHLTEILMDGKVSITYPQDMIKKVRVKQKEFTLLGFKLR